MKLWKKLKFLIARLVHWIAFGKDRVGCKMCDEVESWPEEWRR